MFNPDNMPDSVIQSVKRHLHITWSDSDTDAKLLDMICDAEAALNHKLGAVIDYMQVGAERLVVPTGVDVVEARLYGQVQEPLVASRFVENAV